MHDWPLLDGCDACLFPQLAGSRGPAVHRGAPLEPTVSHHLPGSGSYFVCRYHRCEAGDPGSLSATSNSETKQVSCQFCDFFLLQIYIQCIKDFNNANALKVHCSKDHFTWFFLINSCTVGRSFPWSVEVARGILSFTQSCEKYRTMCEYLAKKGAQRKTNNSYIVSIYKSYRYYNSQFHLQDLC